MRGFVANTDYDWFTYLRAMEPPVEEVNFWRPGSESTFKVLQPGEPFFFKLKAPRNVIAGFGFFAHFSSLPVSMTWESTGTLMGRGRASTCGSVSWRSAPASTWTSIARRTSGSAAS